MQKAKTCGSAESQAAAVDIARAIEAALGCGSETDVCKKKGWAEDDQEKAVPALRVLIAGLYTLTKKERATVDRKRTAHTLAALLAAYHLEHLPTNLLPTGRWLELPDLVGVVDQIDVGGVDQSDEPAAKRRRGVVAPIGGVGGIVEEEEGKEEEQQQQQQQQQQTAAPAVESESSSGEESSSEDESSEEEDSLFAADISAYAVPHKSVKSNYVLNNQAQNDGRVFTTRSRRGTLVCDPRCTREVCYCSVNEHKALGQRK